MEKKLDRTYMEMIKLKSLEDSVFQAHCFIERALPMMIHHQLCEGLNIVSGVHQQELITFEKRKTDEVYENFKLCEGLKPNIKRFRGAIEKFTENCWKHKIGSAPFTYGERRDYWPDISTKWIRGYDKRPYRLEREVPIKRKLEELERQRNQTMEEHINYMFGCERGHVTLLVEKMIAEASATINKNVKRSQTRT